jgi:hypothetical protein
MAYEAGKKPFGSAPGAEPSPEIAGAVSRRPSQPSVGRRRRPQCVRGDDGHVEEAGADGAGRREVLDLAAGADGFLEGRSMHRCASPMITPDLNDCC